MSVARTESIGLIGATSPLGVATASQLAKQGVSVCAGYRHKESIPDRWRTMDRIRPALIELVDDEPDFSELKQCKSLVWLAHLRRGKSDEVQQNIRAFNCFLTALTDSQCSKVVFVSSGGSVYGGTRKLLIDESHDRNPLSPYGQTKREMENMLWDWGRRTAGSTAVIRPANIYGPESLTGRSKGIVGAILRNLAFNARFRLMGSLETVRDYVHVDDVARALVFALNSPASETVWNTGSGVGHSVGQIIELAEIVAGTSLTGVIERVDARPTDVARNVLSISRIWEECRWRPTLELETALKQLLKTAQADTLSSET
jgi:UDP-glucose 4-epimerase